MYRKADGSGITNARLSVGDKLIARVNVGNVAVKYMQDPDVMSLGGAGLGLVSSEMPKMAQQLADGRSYTTTADATGNGHAGTLSGTVSLGPPGLIAGDPDTAATFDGGLISVPLTADLYFAAGDSVTVEAWLRTTMHGGTVFSQYACTPGLIGLDTGTDIGFAGFRVRGSSDVMSLAGGTGPVVTDGAAHHLVGVRDAVVHKVRLYVDGGIVDERDDLTDGDLTTAGTLTWLGNNYPCPTEFPTHGTIDEVAVYRSALSADRVMQHYSQEIRHRTHRRT